MMSARRLAALAALSGLAACASPPSTLLTLDAVAPAPDAVRAGYRGLPVRVPAVHLPALIDRVEFVRQVTAGEAQVDDFARWAAPLGLLARDALVRDLTARLPAGSVLPPGAGGTAKTVRTLDVTVLSFQPGPDGATMQVAWRTLPDGVLHQLSLSAPAVGTTPVAGAQALGSLMGQLADRIVADLG